MSPETMARIFEPFYTTKVIGKGTGLGLAVVYGIVTQNHGTITADSEPEQGTTFEIRIPAVDSEPTESITQPVTPGTERGSATILLVEDETAVRELSRQILQRQGYRVLSAASGPEAIQLMMETTETVSMLVTDVMMPEMNGWQLAEHLLEHRPEMKVLFVSGYSRDRSMPNRLDPNRMAWLQKPFSPARLADRVHAMLKSSPGPVEIPAPHFDLARRNSFAQ